MVADLPISVVAYLLGWRFQLAAAIWLFVAGTGWWYFLSLRLERALQGIRYRYIHRHEGSITRLHI